MGDDSLPTGTTKDAPTVSPGAATDRLLPEIPRFRVLQKLGEGGMGEVYEAEQLTPVRRKVALKVIKWGMDTRQVIGRFESEQQALALMSHPAIARVFEAGATATGRPYFAMELVPGVPITAYCDTHRLTVRERLELFIPVCDGVQHAHQKGVIHRDLKPSNVLVCIQDGKAVPKIIDFGVAKATAQRLTDVTVFTELGQLIGTPAYMSPEQAESTSLDVDTRTDVYSLGVLLYELLVGALPFEPKELRQASLDEIRRRIREDEPPRPSTRLSRMGEVSTTAARNRRTEPRVLSRHLQGDLDWIVMKAMEKDRTRRYETANGLALDIQRHLDLEPVRACPPSTVYRLGKFMRRHRVAAAASAVVVLALLLGMAGTIVGLLRATRAEAHARREAEAARQVSEFLVGLFKVSDPSEARGSTVTAREILDRGSERIKQGLVDQPATQATLMDTMGRVYQSLGLYDRAVPLLEDALSRRRQLLGENHADVASSMNDLGAVLRDKGDYEAAQRLLRQALAVRRKGLGEDHPDVAATVNNLGTVLYGKGDYAAAEPLFREALVRRRKSLGHNHVDVSESLNDLAMTLAARDDFVAAEPLYRESLEMRRSLLGRDHPLVAQSVNNLAMFYYRRGDFPASEPLFREALDMNRRIFGERHPEVSTAMNNLALALRDRGAYAEAEPLFRRVVAMDRELLGPQHPYAAIGLNNLGALLSRTGRHAEAEATVRESLRIQRLTFPDSHWEIANTKSLLGSCLTAARRFEAAEPLLLESYPVLEAHFGTQHRRVRAAIERIVSLYESWGRPGKAAEYRGRLHLSAASQP